MLDLGAGPAHVSLRIAPHAGHVIAMDPEPAMIEEGRRRARLEGVSNLSFVRGGSDDLRRLGDALRPVDDVVISQAFHRMRDQDRVLAELDALVDGSVALVGFVKEPDHDRAWAEGWRVIDELAERYVADRPKPVLPPHDPFPEILRRSAFSDVRLLTYEYDAVVAPSVDAALGHLYSLSYFLERLGDRRPAFEAEVRAALAGADTSPIALRLVDSALIGRRP